VNLVSCIVTRVSLFVSTACYTCFRLPAKKDLSVILNLDTYIGLQYCTKVSILKYSLYVHLCVDMTGGDYV